MRHVTRGLVATTATAAALFFASTPPAFAAAAVEPIATGFGGPLSIAVDAYKNVYVGQSFAGALTKVTPDGARTDLITMPGTSIGAVSVRNLRVTYSQTEGGEAGITSAVVNRWAPGGRIVEVANTLEYEQKRNPDGNRRYGFRHLSKECTSQVPPEVPASYKGLVDSNPYATYVTRDITTYIADAAGNDILRVTKSGRISTVAVLPAVPFVVTPEGAAANGLPDCTIGKTYWFEPVPTDVEVGPDGWLYVSLLPGGPEDPSLGARGRVVKVNPHSGRVHTIAEGFAGATNVAVSALGEVYVAELFGGQVSRVEAGGPVPVASLATPAGLEWKHRQLYVSYDVFGAGAIGAINP